MHHRLGSASFRSLLGGFPWWVPVHSLVHHGRVFTRLFVERGPLTRIFNSSPVPFLRQPAFLCDFEVVGAPWAPSGAHWGTTWSQVLFSGGSWEAFWRPWDIVWGPMVSKGGQNRTKMSSERVPGQGLRKTLQSHASRWRKEVENASLVGWEMWLKCCKYYVNHTFHHF